MERKPLDIRYDALDRALGEVTRQEDRFSCDAIRAAAIWANGGYGKGAAVGVAAVDRWSMFWAPEEAFNIRVDRPHLNARNLNGKVLDCFWLRCNGTELRRLLRIDMLRAAMSNNQARIAELREIIRLGYINMEEY